jgi:hypothetical protein
MPHIPMIPIAHISIAHVTVLHISPVAVGGRGMVAHRYAVGRRRSGRWL